MILTDPKIIPNLWFDRQAEEAARLYTSIFRDSKLGEISRATKAGFEVHGLPEGTVMTAEFEVEGLSFIALNGGPLFKLNPSVSFLVSVGSKEEVDELWAGLSEGGAALMELGAYPFSERYGWTADRYGLSWQVMSRGDGKPERKIIPTLMFVGAQAGRAEEALRLYTSTFGDSRVGPIDRWGRGQEPEREGEIRHAGFTLRGQDFAAMDSRLGHDFAFNEAVSFMVPCRTQDEIDSYWSKLTADGGQESMCGWLKDKFGLSWQVAPLALRTMLHDPDVRKVERVTNAFLKMKKFDIAELTRAFNG